MNPETHAPRINGGAWKPTIDKGPVIDKFLAGPVLSTPYHFRLKLDEVLYKKPASEQ